MRHGRVVALALAIGGMAWTTSCGTDGSSSAVHALRAFDALQAAFAKGDMSDLCGRLSGEAQRQAALFAHGTRDRCTADLHEAFEVAMPKSVRRTRPLPQARSATIEDGRATVTATTGTGDTLDVALAEHRGRWVLDGFFGVPKRIADEAVAGLTTSPFPPAAPGQRVRVSDGPHLPCLPLVIDRFPEIEGGCRMTVTGTGLRVAIDTPFGRHDFGKCRLDYSITSDAAGRTWASRVSFGRPGSRGCPDLNACHDDDGAPLPWRGRIRTSGGRLVHVMDACLDTCVGYFVGRLELALERNPRGWRVEADGAHVGDSGFALYGGLRLQPAAIRVEPPQ